MTNKTIEERIASALNGDAVSAATITELLRDAEAALEKPSDVVAPIQRKLSSCRRGPH